MKAPTRLLLPATVFTIICVSTYGQLTTPARSLGFIYGGSGHRPEVEVVSYLDPTCPDSKAVFPALLKLAQHYSSDQVQLKVHLHNLPYHRNSHVISKAAHVLNKFAPDKDAPFRWLGLVYEKLDNLTTTATAKQTDDQVLQTLTALAVSLTGIPEDQFRTQVADPDIDGLTRLDFKYGCTRGVYGTPMFTINDVFVNAGLWNFDTWKTQIDKLLSTPSLRINII